MSNAPTTSKHKIKVGIIGAGISGLAVANGLLNDPEGRFDVHIYERDTVAFNSERGGYQLRIAANGLEGLKTVADDALWESLSKVWAGDLSRAPAVVNPQNWQVCIDLSEYKAYPSSRPVPRVGLRQALLQRPMTEDRVHLSHTIERYEITQGTNGGVTLFFDQDRSATVDILIGADGSNSVINRLSGLRNKKKLGNWVLIQSRGLINATTKATLPRTLISCGSTMFLSGRNASGFASIYDPMAHDGDEKMWNLFWSVLVPSQLGDSMIAKASGDDDVLISLLIEYLRNGLEFDDSLPNIIMAATTHLRTGYLTSSDKPTHDWRNRIPANSRIILLGDAVHPMTPARGQGANTALTDAGKLVKLLRSTPFDHSASIEDDLSKAVRMFDDEMFERAFKMVKNSEAVTDIDLTKPLGRAMATGLGIVLRVVGWFQSVLEFVGLKRPEDFNFDTRHVAAK